MQMYMMINEYACIIHVYIGSNSNLYVHPSNSKLLCQVSPHLLASLCFARRKERKKERKKEGERGSDFDPK